MCYKYNPIYWQTANLIVDSGAVDENSDDSTNYGKIAIAIAAVQKDNVEVCLPLINSAEFGFIPDEANNRIIYSLKAINGIGDDVVHLIINNRPFTSMNDFYNKMIDTKLIKTSQMVKLIKAGCFTELHSADRRETMDDFLAKYVVKTVDKLTLAQFEKLIIFNREYNFIPTEIHRSIQHKFFADYVLDDRFLFKTVVDPSKKKVPKSGYHDRWFKLDNVAMIFFKNHYSEQSIESVSGEFYIVSEKKFVKENTEKIAPFRAWLSSEEAISSYNACLMQEARNKYAEGSVAKWEMDALSIYCSQEHELKPVNNSEYGIVDYFQLPATPEPYSYFKRKIKQGDSYVTKEFPKYKITRIAGTVLNKYKDRHMVVILTTTGVVNVKFDKGQFAHYDRQLSEHDEDGSKTVQEKSWFTRGNKIVVCGFRRDEQFVAKKYTETVWKHTCGLITQINSDGTIHMQVERGEN